jgi:2-oxoglutarate dehydrogenase E2 component (dihydrolipoamide succinyltransferase)
MAVFEVKVPQLSESVSEAMLLMWHKRVGEAVTRDEKLIDIETDKVVLELPAPGAGVMTKIIKGDGEKVVAGELIALIDSDAAVTVAPAAPIAKSSAVADKTSVAMPSAARMLAANKLTAEQVTGTGKGGRVTKQDVLNALENKTSTTSVTLPSTSLQPVNMPLNLNLGDRPEDRVPMSRLRARIAERLLQSHMTTATLTTFNEVNMQPVMDLRNRYKDKFAEEHGVRLGFMSFFVKAAVAALKKYPVVNASIEGSDIVYHGYFDIGIAISAPRGLVVPVLRNADQMSIADIEKKILELGDQAKEGKLKLEDLTGGTFSISNGGVFGSMLSTPIINPPQSAILGIHATKDRPVVEDGQIVIRPINYLALSYDHRLIDGREAVLALVAIKEAMEDPARLLLDI